MRIKIKRNDTPLEFGKSYLMTFFACSFWWEVKFTRKKSVIVEEMAVREIIDNVPVVDVVRTLRVPKTELKRLINDYDFVQYVMEVQVDETEGSK